MEERALFTDGSVDTKSKIGFGAYLVLDQGFPASSYEPDIEVKQFENTSSTKLEIQTLLWALHELDPSTDRLVIYTDSQNIVGLPSRREKLEEAQYKSKSGKPLSNFELYQEFYRCSDKWECRFEKVKGHQARSQKGRIEEIFTQVDRAARAALRKFRLESY